MEHVTMFKAGKAKPNPAYLAAVRGLPCIICAEFGEQQLSPTTAHHVIHGRFSQRKTPYDMAIPLCDGHHQGMFDRSKVALHNEPSKWKRLYGEDHEWSAVIRDRLSALEARTTEPE